MSKEPPRQFRVTSVRRSTQMPDAGKDAEEWRFEVIDGIELAVKGDDLETAAVTGLRGLIGVLNALQQQLTEARQERDHYEHEAESYETELGKAKQERDSLRDKYGRHIESLSRLLPYVRSSGEAVTDEEIVTRALVKVQERDRYKAALERITEMSGSYAIPKGDNIARHPAGFVVIYEAAYSALAPDAGS